MGRIIPFLFWKITLRFETTNHIYILNMCTTVKESARWVITVSSIVYSIVDVSGSTYPGTMKHWGYISQVVKLHQTEVDTHSALKLFIWSLKEPQKTTTIHKYTNKWHFIMWTIELLIFQWLRHPRSSPLPWLGFRTAKGILSQAAYPTLTDMGMRQNPGTRVWPIYMFKRFHFGFQQCLNQKCLNQSGVVGDPKSSVFVKMSKQMLN